MGDSAYSFSLTTFSRTGKLLQIEYALNAVANGRTSLGICATDGVVIATDKKFSSSLVDTDEIHKVEQINTGCGFVYSGVGPDYRVLGKPFYILSFLLTNNLKKNTHFFRMEITDNVNVFVILNIFFFSNMMTMYSEKREKGSTSLLSSVPRR